MSHKTLSGGFVRCQTIRFLSSVSFWNLLSFTCCGSCPKCTIKGAVCNSGERYFIVESSQVIKYQCFDRCTIGSQSLIPRLSNTNICIGNETHQSTPSRITSCSFNVYEDTESDLLHDKMLYYSIGTITVTLNCIKQGGQIMRLLIGFYPHLNCDCSLQENWADMSMHEYVFLFCFVQSSAFVLDCVTSFGHPLDVCHSIHVYV